MRPSRALRTARLRLTAAEAGDLATLLPLWNQAHVREHLFDGVELVSRETAQGLLDDSSARFAQGGLGLWVAREADGEALVGFAGFLPSESAPNLIYGLDAGRLGRGLATEAARAVIGYAFSRPALARIQADVDEPNQASVRVLERLGMRRTGRRVVNGRALLDYELERP